MSKRPLTREEIAIADRIRAIIAEPAMDLTEESVGIAVGAKQAQVSHWTGGREPVPVKRAKALAHVLRINDPGEICVAYRDIVGAPNELRPDQQAILNLWEVLDADGRRAIQAVGDALAKPARKMKASG